ncbi:hypothetical protein HID58_001048 [Brassica napus]|uniref:Uncharacterized protein n=1 Tax=Brassica napus TaxID=3708 RepID=A0ABQ8EIK1_BRANA|nr:hypothetical protein HID58_001048 [Brassica napus]
MKSQPELLPNPSPVSKLVFGKRFVSGKRWLYSTGFAGFRPRENGDFDSTVLSPASSPVCSGTNRWLEIFSFIGLASIVEFGRVVSLTPAEVDVPSGGCPVIAATEVACRYGGLVTRVPRCEDFYTCSVYASRVNEEAPFGFKTLGLGPNRFAVWLVLVCWALFFFLSVGLGLLDFDPLINFRWKKEKKR